MTAREQLIAYLATLGALVIIYIAALITGALSPAVLGKIEAFALGTLTGGLIGVLRMPSSRGPVGSTESGDVNVRTDKEPAP